LKNLGVGGVITLNEPYETLVPYIFIISCKSSRFFTFSDCVVLCEPIVLGRINTY
jgi:hypothetical protein